MPTGRSWSPWRCSPTSSQTRFTPRADALIAASGPCTSLLVGLVSAGAAWLTRGAGIVPAALGWLAGGYFGLWTVLIGWFIIHGAASERYSAQAEGLAGLKVRDVMARTPTLAPDWWTVEQFLSGLGPDATRQGIFPLVDVDGRFSGALTLGTLASARTPRALGTRLHDLPQGHQLLTTTPDDELATLLLPLHLRGGIAVVLESERPVGVITDADLLRAADLARAGVWRPQGAGR